MKLVCVSHSCVVPDNQALYGRLVRSSGWSVTVVVPARWSDDYGVIRHASRSPAFDGALRPLPVVLGGNIPLHVYRRGLLALLRRERPDAVFIDHEPYAAATAQVFLASAAARVVATGFRSHQNIVKRFPLPVRLAERLVLGRADFAFGVSDEVVGVLDAKGLRTTAAVLPHGIDTDRYRPPDPHRRTEAGPLRLGFVGRLVPEKGVDTLIDALGAMPAGAATATIIGEGPDAAALRRRADALGLGDRVEWLGYAPHDQMAARYAGLDLVVVPSKTQPNWREQFGRVVIEALASGIPVVASDSGELPRLLRRTGGGWTFPEGDARELARLLVSLADRGPERAERAERGRAVVVSDFGLDRVADRLARTVERAVATARHRRVSGRER